MVVRSKLFRIVVLCVVLTALIGYRLRRFLKPSHPRQNAPVVQVTPASLDPDGVYLNRVPPERPAIFRLLQSESDRDVLAKQLPPLAARWAGDYREVLVGLIKAGYVIRPVESFDPDHLNERVVYLRHDIHEWDLAGAVNTMLIENALGVGATYYLMWDYQALERGRRDDFLALRKLAGPGHRFGLHVGLTDEYLYAVHFKDQGAVLSFQATNEFVKTPLFQELADPSFLVHDPECPELLIYPEPEKLKQPFLRDLLRFAQIRTREHLADMRHFFGDVKTVSTHGGAMSYSVANAYRDNPARDGRFLATSEHFFSQKYLREVGVTCSVDNLYKQYQDDLTFVSDNPGKKDMLAADIAEAVANKKSFILLVHPGLWERHIIQSSAGTGPRWSDAVHCWWDWKTMRAKKQ